MQVFRLVFLEYSKGALSCGKDDITAGMRVRNTARMQSRVALVVGAFGWGSGSEVECMKDGGVRDGLGLELG